MMNDEEEKIGSGEQRGLDRILAVSDGVFAFVITLLVLSLAVPALQGNASKNPYTADAQLLRALASDSVAFFSYIVSFFVISIWWVAHHRLFRYIKRYDSALMWRNLFFLIFITIIPFLTELLDQYGNIQLAVVIYNLSQALGGLTLNALWNHASNKHLLITKSLTEAQIKNIRIRGYVPSITFLIATGVVFLIPNGSAFPPSAANLVLFAMFPLMRVVSRKNQETKE